ncbi:PREDICTED: putative receptor-like protein kinase At4g00960 isoform X2 [Populus euphratica]|uniref:Receptor-like protein kinase At4g00960 isoform X2 n=1 Tax=Populus euphratica TaxID=75702 RepID=A0AAJ6Y120_POPEU|nr:PREDICTED: putative receptor-like protein kinase At4g00960 isoform X2 [Populus euphratica]
MTKLKNCLKSLLNPFKFNSSKELGEEDMETIAAREQKQFSFDALASATKDFHLTHKLGEGGFGPVYKGKLDDGREIAVKKLSHSSNQGKKEFTNEAKLLSRVQHRNVVNLLGYCAHGVEKLLVYEYVANESLDKLLFKSDKRQLLDWNRRYDILIGIARGLLYLHEDSHNCIIHRDIKASNILLDDKWVPKIADFGMARLFPEDQTHVNTRVAGTNGYMAPEYVMHGHLSVKADVFSFGVLVLELISGQRNSTFSQQHAEAQNLLDWAYKLHKKNRSPEIMDPVLASSAAAEQVKTCVHIGLLCTQGDPQLRPDMRRIVVLLSKKTCSLEEPTRPGVPGSRYRRARRPAGMSSTAGTSDTARTFGESDSRPFDSSSNANTATASTSAHTIPRLDPHGKRPMES